jgi:hypothetical protein
MKTSSYLSSMTLLGALLCVSVGAADPHWTITLGNRLHYTAALATGDRLQISVIERSHGRDSANAIFHHDETTLIDGGAIFGRWIVTAKSHGDIAFKAMDAVYSFRLVNTSELLTVHVQRTAGEASDTHCITFGSDSVTIGRQMFATDAPGPIPFLRQRGSSLFLKGLMLLRSLGYVTPEAGISPVPFESLYGRAAVVQKQIKPARLVPAPVDCNFDAGFGFPCDADEAPKGNGMVYTKDLPATPQP